MAKYELRIIKITDDGNYIYGASIDPDNLPEEAVEAGAVAQYGRLWSLTTAKQGWPEWDDLPGAHKETWTETFRAGLEDLFRALLPCETEEEAAHRMARSILGRHGDVLRGLKEHDADGPDCGEGE